MSSLSTGLESPVTHFKNKWDESEVITQQGDEAREKQLALLKATTDPEERARLAQRLSAAQATPKVFGTTPEPVDYYAELASQPGQAPAQTDAAAQGQGGSVMTPGESATQPADGVRMDDLRNMADSSRHALATLINDPEFESGMQGKLKDTQDIVNQQLGILNSGVAEQRRLTQEAINDTANFESKRKTLVDAQRDAAEGVQRQIDGITSEIMNYEIDANRAFKSTWQVVGAAIAAAAGAYAQGLSQGRVPNTALAIINKAVDRDIQAQKMELGRLQTAAGIKNNVYGRMLQMHGDELQALAETRAAAMSVVQLRLGSLRATTASKVQAASINLLQKRTEIQHANQTRQAQIQAQTSRVNSVVNEMRTLTSGTAGKKSITERLTAIMPLIDEAIKLYDKVGKLGGIADLTGFAKVTGIFAKEGIEAQAYRQAVTLAIKQVVSIFEGSKPSDMDWKVMIQLLPSAWMSKEYGKGTLGSFKRLIQAQAASGKGFKEGDLHKWALGTGDAQLMGQLEGGVNPTSVEHFKKQLGIEEE